MKNSERMSSNVKGLQWPALQYGHQTLEESVWLETSMIGMEEGTCSMC